MELPGLSLQRFPGSRIDYPEDSGMVLKMAVQLPKLLRGIRQEHIFLKNLVRETGAGLVISDNRYGCWHPGVNPFSLHTSWIYRYRDTSNGLLHCYGKPYIHLSANMMNAGSPTLKLNADLQDVYHIRR